MQRHLMLFLAKVRADRDGGSVHTLMMPVKDGMLAVATPTTTLQ